MNVGFHDALIEDRESGEQGSEPDRITPTGDVPDIEALQNEDCLAVGAQALDQETRITIRS
jgi:hypothetical protein